MQFKQPNKPKSNHLDQNLEIEPTLPKIDQKIAEITSSNLRSLAVFQSCSTSLSSSTETENSEEISKASLGIGVIFVSSEAIHLTTSFDWLCDVANETQSTIITQPMSNLVELEDVTMTTFTLSFMDELENTIEKWRFKFESYPRIAETLETIDEIWQKIFCVPLIDQILS